jgi:hypothetical protein
MLSPSPSYDQPVATSTVIPFGNFIGSALAQTVPAKINAAIQTKTKIFFMLSTSKFLI